MTGSDDIVCPRCEQDFVEWMRLPYTNEVVVWCPECDAFRFTVASLLARPHIYGMTSTTCGAYLQSKGSPQPEGHGTAEPLGRVKWVPGPDGVAGVKPCWCKEFEQLWQEDAFDYARRHLNHIEGHSNTERVGYRCPETGVRWVHDSPEWAPGAMVVRLQRVEESP